MALEGVRAIRQSLPRVMDAPGDLDARGDVLYGAYLAGIALGTTSTGLHHKLCHVLGGMFNLVHADTHSIVLPHAVAFNAPALPEEMARLEEALGAASGDAAGALHDLALESHVPTRAGSRVDRGDSTTPRSRCSRDHDQPRPGHGRSAVAGPRRQRYRSQRRRSSCRMPDGSRAAR